MYKSGTMKNEHLYYYCQLFRSTFAKDGKDCKLQGDVDKVLKDFHRSRKPIGYVSVG